MNIIKGNDSFRCNKSTRSPRYTIQPPRKSTTFVPPSHTVNQYNVYIKQPFKQMVQPEVKPMFRARQLADSGKFMSLGRKTQCSTNRTTNDRNVCYQEEIDPAVYLLDETALAIFHLHRSLQHITPAIKGQPPRGNLCKGRLQLMRPVLPDGPTIRECKGFVPDRRVKMPTSAIKRRGMLIAALQDMRLQQDDGGSHLQLSSRPISQSIHQTSEASSEEGDRPTRDRRLDDFPNNLTADEKV